MQKHVHEIIVSQPVQNASHNICCFWVVDITLASTCAYIYIYIFAYTIFIHAICAYFLALLPYYLQSDKHLMCMVWNENRSEYGLLAGLEFKTIASIPNLLLVPWRPQRCPRVAPTAWLVAMNGKRLLWGVVLVVGMFLSWGMTFTCLARDPVKRYTRQSQMKTHLVHCKHRKTVLRTKTIVFPLFFLQN